MLNKHEPNPPSATLVRGQSSYLQEQQIHLQSNPVLRIASLTYTIASSISVYSLCKLAKTHITYVHIITNQYFPHNSKLCHFFSPDNLKLRRAIANVLPFSMILLNFKWLKRVIGPFIPLIFESSCRKAYQIFSIKDNFPSGLKIIFCSKTVF